MKQISDLTPRQWQIVASRISNRRFNASSRETSGAMAKFADLWMMNSQTARELAESFVEQRRLAPLQDIPGTHSCSDCNHPPFKYPAALGLHRRKVHGIVGKEPNVALPEGRHYLVTRRHAAERLQALLGLKTLTEAARVADQLYKESSPMYKAKDGAWWHRHEKAFLCVENKRGVPVLRTVVPPTWNPTDDFSGGDWNWMHGAESDRVAAT